MYWFVLLPLKDYGRNCRLRELEQAPTPEQKQEVLRLFKQEANEPITENKLDYIQKICTGFFQEEKIASFLNIRKGKVRLFWSSFICHF